VPEGRALHAGFHARAEFEQSRFCAGCHQFFDDPGVNGKPLENTWVEWRASPQAAQGRTCQSCHMPDRAHLWRGIHDAEMVRRAVDVEMTAAVQAESLSASLALHNRDVGHRLPTYVTPRIFLALWQEDAAGEEIDGTRRERAIGREVDFDSWTEVMDSRIPPGGAALLEYHQPRAPTARRLVGRIRVDPDFHYRGVFHWLLGTLSDPEARSRIRQALKRAETSSYVLWEGRRVLSGLPPDASAPRTGPARAVPGQTPPARR